MFQPRLIAKDAAPRGVIWIMVPQPFALLWWLIIAALAGPTGLGLTRIPPQLRLLLLGALWLISLITAAWVSHQEAAQARLSTWAQSMTAIIWLSAGALWGLEGALSVGLTTLLCAASMTLHLGVHARGVDAFYGLWRWPLWRVARFGRAVEVRHVRCFEDPREDLIRLHEPEAGATIEAPCAASARLHEMITSAMTRLF
ncbi:hypothetical protein KKF91_13060 [Myxococcota bacterium]|nr:hypothetical protein [Myxococcota bacterium]MBU1431465.1 hypothetical protein [Myxococcota bacterium]MBU1898543.1 hypothetical protein [Myxococcota bacterium]